MKESVDQHNIQYIEAVVVAGDDANSFVSEKITVQGAKEPDDLSFNMVLQIPKIPTTPPSSKGNSYTLPPSLSLMSSFAIS